MISVTTAPAPRGNTQLVVSGHADPSTEDGRLACVSTSTMLATLLHTQIGSIEAGAPGHVDIVLDPHHFDWAIAWLEMLRDTYPDHFTIQRQDARSTTP